MDSTLLNLENLEQLEIYWQYSEKQLSESVHTMVNNTKYTHTDEMFISFIVKKKSIVLECGQIQIIKWNSAFDQIVTFALKLPSIYK